MATLPLILIEFHKAKAIVTQHPETQLPATQIFLKKSYAQVETSVTQRVSQKSGGLKPVLQGKQKSETISVRFQNGELHIIHAKAQAAGCNTNTYIRASALGSDYQVPANPKLVKALLSLNRELTTHGRNLNQIAKRLNGNIMNADQGVALLDSIRRPLILALLAVKSALTPTAPQP